MGTGSASRPRRRRSAERADVAHLRKTLISRHPHTTLAVRPRRRLHHPAPRFPPSRIPYVARRAFAEYAAGLARTQARPVPPRLALRALFRTLGRALEEDEDFETRFLAAPIGAGHSLRVALEADEARRVRARAPRRE